MEIDDTDNRKKQPDNMAVFAPVEEIKNIELVIDNLETALRELNKVAEGMKAV